MVSRRYRVPSLDKHYIEPEGDHAEAHLADEDDLERAKRLKEENADSADPPERRHNALDGPAKNDRADGVCEPENHQNRGDVRELPAQVRDQDRNDVQHHRDAHHAPNGLDVPASIVDDAGPSADKQESDDLKNHAGG